MVWYRLCQFMIFFRKDVNHSAHSLIKIVFIKRDHNINVMDSSVFVCNSMYSMAIIGKNKRIKTLEIKKYVILPL